MRTRHASMAVLAVVLYGAAAAAEPRSHEIAGSQLLSELLALTPDQVAAIDAERAAQHDTVAGQEQRLDELRERMEQAISARDASALGALLLSEWEIKGEMARARQARLERLMAALSPAQAEKLRVVLSVVSLLHVEEPFQRATGIDARAFGEEREGAEHREIARRHPRGAEAGRAMRHTGSGEPMREHGLPAAERQ